MPHDQPSNTRNYSPVAAATFARARARARPTVNAKPTPLLTRLLLSRASIGLVERLLALRQTVGICLDPHLIDSAASCVEVLALPDSQVLLMDDAVHELATSLPLPANTDGQLKPWLLVTSKRQVGAGLRALEQGARGILSPDAQAEEVLRAIRAVHAGELWISRSLMAQMLESLLQHKQSPALDTQPILLNKRQREIVRGVAQGLSNEQIGHRLGISAATVLTHLHKVFEQSGPRMPPRPSGRSCV